MKTLITKLFNNPLISGSSILFIGSLSGNFFHFLFNLFMSRNLSVVDYGVLASIMSLITLPSLLYSAITPTVVSFAAMYFANNQLGHVHGLFIKINRVAISIGLSFLLIFTLFSTQIGAFLHIKNSPLLIITGGLLVLIGFLSVVTASFIQAKLSFLFLSIVNFLLGFLKFIFGVLFLFWGFGIQGALSAVALSALVTYLMSFYPMKFIFQKRIDIPHVQYNEIIRFAIPATCSLVSITCFITIDILLAKHFLSAKDAGLYAGLALAGKVIFFFSAPIGMAMFPLIVQKKAKNENYQAIFLLSLLLVLIPSLSISLFYYLFPHFSILFFLKKTEYLQIANFLWIYGIYMTVYSLLSVMTNYFLSIRKTKIFLPLAVGACAQSLLIWFFHNSFLQIITISFIIVCLLVIILLGYFFKLYAEER